MMTISFVIAAVSAGILGGYIIGTEVERYRNNESALAFLANEIVRRVKEDK